MWLSFALVSALLLSVRRVYEKELTARFGNFSLAFVLQMFSVPMVFALLFFFPLPVDIFHLPLRFWAPLAFIAFIIAPLQTYFLYRSLREGELSEVTPVSSLLPVFNIATSFFFIGELPSPYGFVGILLIVSATLLLLSDTKDGARLGYNRPVLFMIITVLCSAIGSTLDKIAISVSTPVFYSFVNISGGAIMYLVFTYIYRQQGELRQIRDLFSTLLMLGAVLALGFLAFISAFAIAPTSYVLAIRSGGFLVAALWGLIFLHESLSAKKFLALMLFALGTVALAFG